MLCEDENFVIFFFFNGFGDAGQRGIDARHRRFYRSLLYGAFGVVLVQQGDGHWFLRSLAFYVGSGFYFFLELGVRSIILVTRGVLATASLYAGVCTDLWDFFLVCAIAGS